MFKWGGKQKAAFKAVKEIHVLASAEILAYYNKHTKTRVIPGASLVGLGAVLAQEHYEWQLELLRKRESNGS